MKYYIIAGEASGDLHGASLMHWLSKNNPKSEFRIWGGDLMASEGGFLVKHYRDLAFMGFWEVLRNIRTILSNLALCKSDILEFEPDVLILIDYPGFNLRIAKWANNRGLKVFYYISPQVWAWKSSRVKGIKEWVDDMFVILPFEKDFYAQFGYEVHYVGHPLLDVVNDFKVKPSFRNAIGINDDRPVIALLPGSRQQEIKRMLPVMLEMAGRFPDHEFIIAGAPGIQEAFYSRLSLGYSVKIVYNQTYALLGIATAALVTSGTATLETALFNVPQVVCYKGNRWSYYLARRLVKVEYIALVNLILERKAVTELIQGDFNTSRLENELNRILEKDERQKILADYKILKERLGSQGAAKRAAGLMTSFLEKKKLPPGK